MIWAFSNHLWQSTLFAIATGLLVLAFRKNRAQVRYGLWFSASCKFLVPFSVLMHLAHDFAWVPVAKNAATPAVSFTMEQISRPFPNALRSNFSVATHPTDLLPKFIVGLWLCGVGAVVLMRLRQWVHIRALVRASSPLKTPASVEVRSCEGMLEPSVIGLFRPVLLLPGDILRRLTPLQLEAVLAHELCHVRRRDNLTSAIHMIVEALFWFHPLVWWIGAHLLRERERACDEAVLNAGTEPRVYAEAILNVCRLFIESPLLCVSGVTGSNLKRRMEAILANYIGQR
jgi:bla regulator protein blaR1